jgi:hypothetical protein
MNKVQNGSGRSELGVTYIYKQTFFNKLYILSGHVLGAALRAV